jgi:DNA ligase D-like protein (predicted ligase)
MSEMIDTKIEPMLCQPGDISKLTSEQWTFEAKHDGNRLIVRHDDGHLDLQSRSGRDSTADYRLKITSDHNMVLDGEAVSLNAAGRPEFNLIQNRATTRVDYWAFDILELDGKDLTRVPYRKRRQILEHVGELSEGFTVPPLLRCRTGKDAQALSQRWGIEGVVAKHRDSLYEHGKRSRNWLKSKNWLEDDVVIGGWKPGSGSRENTIGSILMGTPDRKGNLKFCGRVGTGFSDAELADLLALFQSIETAHSPFSSVPGPDAKGARWVKPDLTAAVQYGLKTADGRLRHPSWRGLR